MSHVSDRKVVHEGPLDAPIFLVGEAPGTHENVALRPFVGPSGDLLNMSLDQVGLSRDMLRIGNVLNYQPAKNLFQHANETWQLATSKEELTEYLKSHQHKIIVPMGNKALEFFTGHVSIEKHRGSVYTHGNTLVVPTIHPAAILRDGSHTPAFLNDLLKVKRLLTEPYVSPTFRFNIAPSWMELEELMPSLLSAPRLWCDIETKMYTSYIRCIGFAWTPYDAVCIFNDAHEGMGPMFRKTLQRLLENDVPKTFHNGFFDTHMLAENGINVTGWDYDTMLMQHSLQPELPLGLDYCTSMYTDINYYKDDGKESGDKISKERLGVYNCKDVVATCKVELAQREEADEIAWRMFKNKFAQVPVAREYSTCGLLLDPERKELLESRVVAQRSTSYTLFFHILSLHGLKEDQYFKVTQHQKVKDFLYQTLGLPVKMNQDGKVTADEDAIVELIGTAKRKIQELKTDKGKYPWELKLAALKLILEIRGQEKLLSSYICVETSLDGRARSVYNITGTETNRWSASSWYDGSGWNGQTIPRLKI